MRSKQALLLTIGILRISGAVVMCAGASESCFSRTQNCVTLSSTEAVSMVRGIHERSFMWYVWS